MRNTLLANASLALLFLLPGAAQTQQRGPIQIDQVQVGYGAIGAISGLAEFKAGAWTPVYVTVRSGLEGSKKGELVVEAVDSDDVRNRYTVPLPPLEPSEQVTLLTYTRPGNSGSEIVISCRIDGRTVASKQDVYASLDLNNHLYLTIGSRAPGLRASLRPTPAGTPEENEDDDVKGMGNVHVVSLRELRLLPRRWFAYEPIDLIVLTTADREFLTGLLDEQEGRKQALVDWVRRGGRLIVSVGRNQDVVSKIEGLQAMLPVTINGIVPTQRLSAVEPWAGQQRAPLVNPKPRNSPNAPPPPIDVAKLESRPGKEITMHLSQGDTPLVMEGAFGLGRVTVVAFDLDQLPFTAWPAPAQKTFWKSLRDKVALAVPTDQGGPRGRMMGYPQGDNADLASQLQINLEDFEDVPVISFGWVALFIFLYILVVGPLDYFFLKKVVKRLELTWITFPTVVITISVAAYFTAYWLKGNDQRINKVDFLDIDLHSQQVYGNTWFTIFSPRIQHYTIGLDPSDAGWVTSRQEGSMMLTWMGRPETSWSGTGRSHSQGLFRRAYDYDRDATALVGVPIQVWSTKSFTAAWQMPFDSARPAIGANLAHPKEQAKSITGTITSHLPVPLEEVFLYHTDGSEGKWRSLGRLAPGVPQRIENVLKGQGEATAAWLSSVPSEANRQTTGQTRRSYARSSEPTVSVMKRLLFYGKSNKANSRNNVLAHLDESWRLDHQNEVILFGRIPRQDGRAEEITNNPESPTRLWLNGLPGLGQPRPEIQGTLSQETYVRIFIPVRNAE